MSLPNLNISPTESLYDGPFTSEDYLREETYRYTRNAVESAVTLIPDAYTSPDFFVLEQQKVFASSWVPVGCISDVRLPGDAIVTKVADQSIIVTRDQEGQLRAFYNVCRHRGARLLDEGCQKIDRFVRCPYHNWAYDLQGKCLGTPLFTGSDIPQEMQGIFDMTDIKKFDKADYGLYPINVDSWGFLVFVNLQSDPVSLAEQLGDLPNVVPITVSTNGRWYEKRSIISRPTISLSARISWNTIIYPGSIRS